MLHAKFRGNRSSGSGEQVFFFFFGGGGGGGLTIYGRGSHLGQVTQIPRTILVPPTLGGSTQILALIGQAVWEMFEIVDGRTDAGAWLYYKLTYRYGPILATDSHRKFYLSSESDI